MRKQNPCKTLGQTNFDSRAVREGIIDDNLKLLVSAQNQRNVDGFLQKTQMQREKFEKFVIGKSTRENSRNLVKNILNGFNPLSERLCDKIIDASKGSPLYIGQVLLLMNESGMFNFDGILPRQVIPQPHLQKELNR